MRITGNIATQDIRMSSEKRRKGSVSEDYEIIAGWFDEHRSRDLGEPGYLELLIQKKPAGRILDLGCGMGEPIASYLLSKGEQVLGVDGCVNLLALAQKRFPTADWIRSDMRTYAPGEKFSAVIAWHSLFHLSADDQTEMIPKISDWLLPGGVFVFTSGTERGEIFSDNGGVNLYHASLSEKEYQQLLKKFCFEVLKYQRKDPDCGEATIWFCRKFNENSG